MTLTFNPRRAVVMTHTQKNIQVQRSNGFKGRVETNRRTEEAGFSLSGALLEKYVGGLPCFNTVAQLPDCLRTQRCFPRRVSIPVLPQAGRSLAYFETSLSAA